MCHKHDIKAKHMDSMQQHRSAHIAATLEMFSTHSQPMQGMHGVRLRPGSSLVELRVRLYNRTPLTQTFLWCVTGPGAGRCTAVASPGCPAHITSPPLDAARRTYYM